MPTVLRQSLTGKILFECHEVKYVIKYDNFQKGLRTANDQSSSSEIKEYGEIPKLTSDFVFHKPKSNAAITLHSVHIKSK